MTNGRVRELAHSHRKRLEQSPRGHDYSTQGDASALHLTRSSLPFSIQPPPHPHPRALALPAGFMLPCVLFTPSAVSVTVMYLPGPGK